MKFSFNLIDQPWIPCLCLNGKCAEIGLRDTLVQAHTLRETRADTPLETASLHRLLLVMLHRVFGPKDRAAWIAMWQRRDRGFDSESLTNYLEKWRHKFDLFDETHPFFQIPTEARRVKGKSMSNKKRKGHDEVEMLFQTRIKTQKDTVNKMITQLVADATLFEHTLDDQERGAVLSPAQAARALIAVQNYGLGYNQFVDAPCSKGILFLIQGSTLFETLMLNLVRYPIESGDYGSTDDDKPSWEQESVLSVHANGVTIDRDVSITQTKKKQGKQAKAEEEFEEKRFYSEFSPLGQLDYLTWHNRKIHLFPEPLNGSVVIRSIAWTPGIRLQQDVTDPMQFWTKSDAGWKETSFRVERALWRDIDTVLRLADVGADIRAIASIGWISELAKKDVDLLPRVNILSAFGMAKKQAKPVYLCQETTPLPIELLTTPALVSELTRALKIAETSSRTIRRATFLLAWITQQPSVDLDKLIKQQKHLDGDSDKHSVFQKVNILIDERMRKGSLDDNKIKDEQGRIAKRAYRLLASWGLEHHYWSRLEAHFHRFIQDLPADPNATLTTWREEVRHAARAAFDQALQYAGNDRRAQRALALATQQFHIGLAQAIGKAKTDVQSDSDMDATDEIEIAEEAFGDMDETTQDEQDRGDDA